MKTPKKTKKRSPLNIRFKGFKNLKIGQRKSYVPAKSIDHDKNFMDLKDHDSKPFYFTQ